MIIARERLFWKEVFREMGNVWPYTRFLRQLLDKLDKNTGLGESTDYNAVMDWAYKTIDRSIGEPQKLVLGDPLHEIHIIDEDYYGIGWRFTVPHPFNFDKTFETLRVEEWQDRKKASTSICRCSHMIISPILLDVAWRNSRTIEEDKQAREAMQAKESKNENC